MHGGAILTSMRRTLLALACAVIALPATRAQTVAISGQVVLRDNGQPLGYTTIAVLSYGTQRLASDSGTFHLLDLAPGKVRFRFKRIGFAPKDTVLTLVAGETASLRIEMTRLDIQLPTVVVSAKCTNETPFEPKPGVLAELFDQVKQNAERMVLLAAAKPFVMRVTHVRGYRVREKPFAPFEELTTTRGPLPVVRYEPKRVARPYEINGRTVWGIHIPELADFADTAFTNNHCVRYAGQMRFDEDSVIAVNFEPVPWLDKEVDLKGTVYLRVNDYQIVAVVAALNRQLPGFRHIREYTHQTRFKEIVPGVPALFEWELVNYFRNGAPSVVEMGKVIEIRWTDSTAVRVDSARLP
jgi:hypothetical protein